MHRQPKLLWSPSWLVGSLFLSLVRSGACSLRGAVPPFRSHTQSSQSMTSFVMTKVLHESAYHGCRFAAVKNVFFFVFAIGGEEF